MCTPLMMVHMGVVNSVSGLFGFEICKASDPMEGLCGLADWAGCLCMDMCMDMCIGICTDMLTDMRVDMRIDMCMRMEVHIHTYVCYQTCVQTCVSHV